MTYKEFINRAVRGCDDCSAQGNPADPCHSFGCNKEVTPEELRTMGLAFICEECGDNIVTNLFGDEDDNEYRCNACKKIGDNGERIK